MTKTTTIAKPYAKAIFDLAYEQNQIAKWLHNLKFLARFSTELQKNKLLNNPQINHQQKMDLFSTLIKHAPETTNLLKLLGERKKLHLIPDIANSYQQLFFAHNNILKIKVVSALKLTPTQKKQLLKTFQQKYQTKILLHCSVDPKLVGGAIIYLGDKTIDGSLKGALLRLQQNLLIQNTYDKTK